MKKLDSKLIAARNAIANKSGEVYVDTGVKILIAEQCAAEYSSYNTYPMTAPDFVGEALDVLEECLGRYPEGFFRQLPHGTFEHI